MSFNKRRFPGAGGTIQFQSSEPIIPQLYPPYPYLSNLDPQPPSADTSSTNNNTTSSKWNPKATEKDILKFSRQLRFYGRDNFLNVGDVEDLDEQEQQQQRKKDNDDALLDDNIGQQQSAQQNDDNLFANLQQNTKSQKITTPGQKWNTFLESCTQKFYPSELLESKQKIMQDMVKFEALKSQKTLDELLNGTEDGKDTFQEEEDEDASAATQRRKKRRRRGGNDDDMDQDVDQDDAREFANAMRCDDDEELEDDAREMEGGQDDEGVM